MNSKTFDDIKISPVETGLYYCNTRYYNPEWGRWLNADDVSYLDPESINGLNLYAYCLNKPVMYSDPNGTFVITTAAIIGVVKLMAIGFAVGATVAGGFEIGRQVSNEGWKLADWDWKQIGLSTLGGGVAGAISAIPIPGAGFFSYLGTFAIGGFASVAGGWISGSVTDFNSGLIAFGIGGFSNVAARGISNGINKIISRRSQNILQNHFIYDNMTSADLIMTLSSGYNNFTRETAKLVALGLGSFSKSISYSIINSGLSSLMSGWY